MDNKCLGCVMEMTEAKNNQDESARWSGSIMSGEWKGTGSWEENGTWSGQGKWLGGALLNGTWDGKGDWKSSDESGGNWNGSGKLKSNIPIGNLTILLAVIGLIANIVAAALGLIVSAGGWITTIISIMAISALLYMSGSVLGKTTKGKWKAKGSWRDAGEFRILDISGDWKLGSLEGILSGEMKDLKPKF